jgi:cyanophycin synthetase
MTTLSGAANHVSTRKPASIQISVGFDGVVREAERRGYRVTPVGLGAILRIDDGPRSARMLGAITDRTSHLAIQIAANKQATKNLLARAGLPVPPGGLAFTADEALAIGRQVGGPVVVKPNGGHQGRGVRAGLSDPEAIRAAYDSALASRQGPALVERYNPGRDLRVLVVNGQMAAATERAPPTVMGDGESPLSALIARLNADPRRGAGHEEPMTRVEIDADLIADLAAQTLTLEDVPAAGRSVRLRLIAGLSRGGEAIDRTDEVHPKLAALAVEAGHVIGLDIAGVDIMAENFGDPPDISGAEIIEVNGSPGLRMHLYPAVGKARDVGGAILDYLFGGSA